MNKLADSLSPDSLQALGVGDEPQPNVAILDDFRQKPKAPRPKSTPEEKRLARALNFWSSSYKAAGRCVFNRTVAVVAFDEVFDLVKQKHEPARAAFAAMHKQARALYGSQVLSPEHFDRACALGLLERKRKG